MVGLIPIKMKYEDVIRGDRTHLEWFKLFQCEPCDGVSDMFSMILCNSCDDGGSGLTFLAGYIFF